MALEGGWLCSIQAVCGGIERYPLVLDQDLSGPLYLLSQGPLLSWICWNTLWHLQTSQECTFVALLKGPLWEALVLPTTYWFATGLHFPPSLPRIWSDNTVHQPAYRTGSEKASDTHIITKITFALVSPDCILPYRVEQINSDRFDNCRFQVSWHCRRHRNMKTWDSPWLHSAQY